LGRDARAEWIEVTWPNGKVERFDAAEAKAGTSLILREGTSRAQMLATKRAKLPDPLTRSEIFARGLKIAVGKPLPPLMLKAVTRGSATTRTTLTDLLKPGRRLMINVWATWCGPCAREMPELENLRSRIAARGIDLIGLNVDTEPDADVRGFIAEHRVRYPNYLGGVAAIEELYATDELSVPLTIVVNDKGNVTQIIPGWSEETQRKFTELAGEDQSPAAQSKSLDQK